MVGRMEKFLAKRVDVRILLLTILAGVIVLVIFGDMVRRAAQDGEKAGALANAALTVAEIPLTTMLLLTGQAGPADFVTESRVTALDRELYEPLSLPEPRQDLTPPIAWTSGKGDRQPVALMFRLTESGEENLLIANNERRIVRRFPITVPSLSGRYEALEGSATPRMLDDGTVIVFPLGGDGLYRKDLCDRVIWATPGMFHHNFSAVDGKLVVFGLPKAEITESDRLRHSWSDIINVVDLETGRIERSVTIDEIARANIGHVDPLLWERWRDNVNENGVLWDDFIHLNKIEVLSEAMAPEYPGLPAGAWLMSSRNLNLVFIVDPATLRILWYSHGHTQVQHDPDFIGGNRIAVFNNSYARNTPNPSDPRNFSSIRVYDFGTGEWTEVYNGQPARAYTVFSGAVDRAANGDRMLILTNQGRYLEVSPDGEVLADFVNVRDEDSIYWTKHAQYLTDAQFRIASELSCRG